MTLRENHTLKLLRNQQVAHGLWLHSHDFHIARILAAQNILDWLLVDLEHTPVDLSTASMIMASIADVSQGKCSPMARIASNTQAQVKQALDAGAQGIIVPMINSADEAREVVQYARYPPQGQRGGGGLTPHLGFNMTNHASYIPQANPEILVAIQVETIEAVNQIEDIVQVDGLDMIFVGPFDLHISMGLQPSLWSDNPQFLDAIKRVVETCQQANIPLGTIVPNAEQAKIRAEQGFRFIGVGTDIFHLVSRINQQFSSLKS